MAGARSGKGPIEIGRGSRGEASACADARRVCLELFPPASTRNGLIDVEGVPGTFHFKIKQYGSHIFQAN